MTLTPICLLWDLGVGLLSTKQFNNSFRGPYSDAYWCSCCTIKVWNFGAWFVDQQGKGRCKVHF